MSEVPPGPEKVEQPKKPNIVRRLYEWVLSWAETPYGLPALFVLSFIESSFFPIPPDVLLIALAVAAPTKAFRFAMWCTIASVLGGMFGYLIGFAMWGFLEPYVIPAVFSAELFEKATTKYDEWGVLIVFTAAFSPIPYKVFTIAGGVAQINFLAFVLTSIVGRGARFYMVAWVIRRYGTQARELIDRHFNLFTIAFTILLVGAFVLIKVLL